MNFKNVASPGLRPIRNFFEENFFSSNENEEIIEGGGEEETKKGENEENKEKKEEENEEKKEEEKKEGKKNKKKERKTCPICDFKFYDVNKHLKNYKGSKENRHRNEYKWQKTLKILKFNEAVEKNLENIDDVFISGNFYLKEDPANKEISEKIKNICFKYGFPLNSKK